MNLILVCKHYVFNDCINVSSFLDLLKDPKLLVVVYALCIDPYIFMEFFNGKS